MLIVETDLGRDPDDFFSLCYLISAGVKIHTLLITPGDPDQLAIGDFLADYLEQDFDVIPSMPLRNKKSSGGIHYDILRKYKYPIEIGFEPRSGKLLSLDVNDKELFVIGPPTAIGDVLADSTSANIPKITVQGGFIGYDIHGLQCERLQKFENKTTVSTFNLGGAVRQAETLVEYPCANKRFVSKNVCHTIVYTKEIHEKVCSYPANNKAMELLREGMSMYLAKHPDGKKFHDPTAAVCHLHPEIATWVKAKLYRENNQWGAKLADDGYDIIVDINREKLWEHIGAGN